MRGDGRALAADGLTSSINCTNVSLHRSDSAATDGVHNAESCSPLLLMRLPCLGMGTRGGWSLA